MRPRSLVALLRIALPAVACSGAPAPTGPAVDASGSDPSGASDPSSSSSRTDSAGMRAQRNVCVTLDYGHERPNSDYFLQFPDDAAALSYSRDFLAVSEMPRPLEVTHDERLTRILRRVYEGFHTVFPRETEGLEEPPRLVVVEADGANAFAGFDERPSINKAPWVFWVHYPVLTEPRPDDEVAGLFSHELAHLILRNLLPETRAKIRTRYHVPGGREHGIIGAAVVEDPEVARHVEEIRELGTLVGRDVVLGPLPLAAFEDSKYQSMLTTLMTEERARSTDPSACDAAESGLRRVRALYEPNVSVHDFILRLGGPQRDQLARYARSTADSMRKCLGHATMSLFELKVRDQFSMLPPEEARPYIERMLDPTTEEHATARATLMTTEVERVVDAKNAPTIERFFEVVETLHARIGELESDPRWPIDELRVFDMEEDADDAAVRVLKAIGSDPLSNARFFVNLMPDPDACFRLVASGQVPPYGRFIDPHNGTCWRWFHSIEFAKALDRCPATNAEATRADTASSARVSLAAPSPPRAKRRGLFR